MPEELNVWMHDATDHAEVAIAGPVTPENAWRLWRTLEAAFAMYSRVTINLAAAPVVDPLVLADLLEVRDRLTARDRTITLVGIPPAGPNPAHLHPRDDAPRRPAPPRARQDPAQPVAPNHRRGRCGHAGHEHVEVALTRSSGHGRDTDRDRRLVAQVAARLSRRHPLLPREMVEQVVRHHYGSYGSAPIRDFVPILVERAVNDHLDDLAR